MPQDLSAVRWPLHTERLSIRPGTVDDLEATWQIRHLPEVGRWLTSASSNRDQYAEKFIDPERLSRTLVIELGGVVIGDLYLLVQDAWSQSEVADRARGVEAELGWVLAPSYTGHGYATEAVAELIRVCFEELGLRRVLANCFAENGASWRLMERLGMRRETYTVRESLHRSGEWLDGMTYALLADEWRAAREPAAAADKPDA